MNKACARCSKTVYAQEELKCLDKTWHKGCFKCWECGMTLNMRTYKGFNKFPYCEAHIPKPKATTVAETPEYARIAENTKIQSNVQYHADFEKAKGKYTTVADDPETMRIKEASKMISNVTYHGDLQKKAEMELRRNLSPENGDEPPNRGPSQQTSHHAVPVQHQPSSGSYGRQPGNKVLPTGGEQGQMADSPYSARHSATVVYTSQKGAMEQPTGPQRHIGSIADYDPTPDDRARYQQQQQHQQAGFRGYPQPHHQPPQHHQPQPQQQQVYHQQPPQYQQAQQQRGHQQPPRHGPTHQPPLDYYALHHQQPHHQPQQHHPQHVGHLTQSSGHASGQPAPSGKVSASFGRCYRAMYDYAAADGDEVSFKDGDLIINCSPVDEGWMTGTVQRTMHTGMLPANYVEPVN